MISLPPPHKLPRVILGLTSTNKLIFSWWALEPKEETKQGQGTENYRESEKNVYHFFVFGLEATLSSYN